MITVRIWDLPTRLFHWLLVASVLALVITGNVGGDAMVWHFRLGQIVLSLVLFRIVWGFVGGHWSRWAQLPLGPVRTLAYLRGSGAQATGWPGHNPLGSWSVVLMLLWLLLQVGTGLVSDDEIAYAGPLTALVSGATVSAATAWHKGLGKLVLLVLVLVHVAAIVWYRLRKGQALVPPMLHGDKSLPADVRPSRDGWIQRLLALVVLTCCVAAVQRLVALGTQ
jgi:cytochrome b